MIIDSSFNDLYKVIENEYTEKCNKLWFEYLKELQQIDFIKKITLTTSENSDGFSILVYINDIISYNVDTPNEFIYKIIFNIDKYVYTLKSFFDMTYGIDTKIDIDMKTLEITTDSYFS